MDLTRYRERESERLRIADLLELAMVESGAALDVGTRDGHFARLLADRFECVAALDLTTPDISDSRIVCIAGDVMKLPFPDASFDLVVCAEVLEHIAPSMLEAACDELQRVTRGHLLIGVPYKQDTRVGRTTCVSCGAHNPPWGHVNCFDELRLRRLFAGLAAERTSFVGINEDAANSVSTSLMDLAGNPYGTYGQDEPCVNCGGRLDQAPPRRFHHKVLTKAALGASLIARPFKSQHANWIHVLMRKQQPRGPGPNAISGSVG